jgi:glucokinase
MNAYIAIDIGGTQTDRFYQKWNRTIQSKRYNTHKPGVYALDNMFVQIDSLWSTYQGQSDRVAAPGPLDPSRRDLFCPNIPEWKTMPLDAEMVNHFHVPVRLGTDANLAAYGEWPSERAETHHLIYLTSSNAWWWNHLQ